MNANYCPGVMDLNSAIETWISHFTKILLNKNSKNYDNKSINGFKNGNTTSKAHNLIISILNQDAPMCVENVDKILLSAFKTLEITSIGSITYMHLTRVLETKHIINQPLPTEEITTLKEILDQCTELYNLSMNETLPTQINSTVQTSKQQEETANLNSVVVSPLLLNITTSALPNNPSLLDKNKNNCNGQSDFSAMVQSITSAVGNQLSSKFDKFDQELRSINDRFDSINANQTSSWHNSNNFSVRPPCPDEIKSTIKHMVNKLHRFKNHINIWKEHLKNKTVPKQMDYGHYPKPFLPRDVKFCTSYDELIKKFHTETLNFLISDSSDRLKDIEKNIEDKRKILISTLGDEVAADNIVESAYIDANKQYKADFDKSFYKAMRMFPTSNLQKMLDHSPQESSPPKKKSYIVPEPAIQIIGSNPAVFPKSSNHHRPQAFQHRPNHRQSLIYQSPIGYFPNKNITINQNTSGINQSDHYKDDRQNSTFNDIHYSDRRPVQTNHTTRNFNTPNNSDQKYFRQAKRYHPQK